jgi:hypothetical protein
VEKYPRELVQISGWLGAWGTALYKFSSVVSAVNPRLTWTIHEFPLRVPALRGESCRRSNDEAEGNRCDWQSTHDIAPFKFVVSV